MKAVVTWLKPRLPALFRDGVGVAGAAAMIHGVGLVYVPAAWVLCGVMMVAAGWLLAKRGG
jgi:hypothetical protein